MQVRLKRNWFNPKGNRMRVHGKGTVYEMPEEWKDLLPSTAEILEENAPVIPLISSEREPDTFSEMNKLAELTPTVESIAQQAHEAIIASKKEQAKRNRQAGAAKAREKRFAKKENENVQMA